ncbi:MAG: hypothetical protein GY845_26040 [Planctomycetes bacterium]|nr:hypothetical protein [Planctomycetota bacterium]
MARKRTKDEALDRLQAKRDELGDDAGRITRASFGLAAGLIMLDPLNRLADDRIVLPLDMVCIPAYQAYLIQGTPSMQIYVRAGETIIPTGGNVRDVQEVLDESATDFQVEVENKVSPTPSAYQKRYKKQFARLKPKFVKKDGTWKKNGFKACVKASHAAARKK